jgi:hypothetical protein
MLQNATLKNAKILFFYECKECDFKCSKKSDYTRHISTLKHQKQQNATYFTPKSATAYCVMCHKSFKHTSSMYRHKKLCSGKSEPDFLHNSDDIVNENENVTLKTDEIMELIKQNQEFKQLLIEQNQKISKQNDQIIELAKEGKYITNNTTNNNHFSLNVFLNEKCKDAINLVDFVDSLQIQIHDLEETARLGYAEGISKIFIRGLNQLDFHKRPICCSDAKREILYIRDNNVWEKEDDNKSHITLAIKQLGHKNIKQIPLWQKENPMYNNPDSKQNDRYIKLVYNAMSGSTKEEQQQNICKVIKNIAKEVTIDKKDTKNIL